MTTMFGRASGRCRFPAVEVRDAPLIVAVHGGTYDSAYFDVPGHSLLARAEANGIPIIAVDRQGYGDTPLVPASEMTLAGQARFLTGVLAEIWAGHGGERPGLVVIGHSIGAAIALIAAGNSGDLPLLGVAVSGVGMCTPPDHSGAWAALPDTDLVTLPEAMKDMVMFGPAGSFAPAAVAAARQANRTVPKKELIEITGVWSGYARDKLGQITAAVHYRQGEGDKLWQVDEGQVQAFAAALTRSSRVDAAMLRGTGHCLDFHMIGPAFQTAQLAFALQCGAEARYLT